MPSASYSGKTALQTSCKLGSALRAEGRCWCDPCAGGLQPSSLFCINGVSTTCVEKRTMMKRNLTDGGNKDDAGSMVLVEETDAIPFCMTLDALAKQNMLIQ